MVKIMDLGSLGERKILENIVFKYLDSKQKYIDEDAVAIRIGNKNIIMNVDTFVKSTDMPKSMGYYHVGWRIVTMTMSDIIAKSGVPKVFLCSITAPIDMNEKNFKDILSGIRDACNYYRCKYLGGDLGSGEDLVVSGVGIGLSDKFIARSEAKVGETVWVTGEFSISAIALHFLLHGGKKIGGLEVIIEKFFRPTVEPDLALALYDIASASIDSSDGLAVALNEISRLSNVSITLENIPIAKAVYDYARVNNLDPMKMALYCGEEYEIIFTTKASEDEVYEIFEKYKLRRPIKIGIVRRGTGVYYGGKKIPRKGWEHFRK